MFSIEVQAALTAKAQEYGIEPAALLAIAEIESGGRAYATVAGRQEPLVRFEGHYFDRRLTGAKREEARRLGLASPAAGEIRNPSGQAARWALIERAAAIDRKAAHESVSWGIGQVMGAHWAWLGFSSVDALVTTARSGIGGQAELMLRYIARAGLVQSIRDRDWRAFARGYNGPAYRKNRYDTRIAQAFARHGGPADSDAPLRRGSVGQRVRALQQALADHGHTLQIDGVFGPATETMLRAFQSAHRLTVDGIAGPRTLAALAARPEVQTLAGWLARLLRALWRR